MKNNHNMYEVCPVKYRKAPLWRKRGLILKTWRVTQLHICIIWAICLKTVFLCLLRHSLWRTAKTSSFQYPTQLGRMADTWNFVVWLAVARKSYSGVKKHHWCSVWWFFSEKNSNLCHYKDIKGGRRCLQHQKLRQRSHKEDDQFGRRYRHQRAERCQCYFSGLLLVPMMCNVYTDTTYKTLT